MDVRILVLPILVLLGGGCRPAPQAIARTAGPVEAMTVAGGYVWWVERDDAGRSSVLRAPAGGGAVEQRCRAEWVNGLAVIDDVAYVVRSNGYHQTSIAACAGGDQAPASIDLDPVGYSTNPVADGAWLTWTAASPGDRALMLVRWQVGGPSTPHVLWSGDAMTIPPVSAARSDDGSILWEGSGGVMSMSRDGVASRIAKTDGLAAIGAGATAWWERPLTWDSAPPTPVVLPGPSSSPPPPLWPRIRAALGLEKDIAREEPATVTLVRGGRRILTGIVGAIAGDARATFWIDEGAPTRIHHGPSGYECNSCYDSIEPVPGTGGIRYSTGGRAHTLARGDFAPAIAIDDRWVYAVDVTASRIVRIAR